MRSLLDRFDAWVDDGPFTARDLGLARIIYAALLLVTTPALRATSNMPRVTWRPPFGPLRLLDSPPSNAATTTIAVVLSVGLVMLLLGVFTTWSSLVVGVAYLLNDGIGNSFGFVAHYILVAVVPLTCCWAGWGRRYSVDALLRRRETRSDEDVPQWPLRLLALCIGAGFVTAAVPKILAGWLDPSTQAAYGHIVKGTLTRGPQNLAQRAADFHAPLFWELADWATIALEAGVIVSVLLSWRWFQGMLVALMSFHLGIAFTLNIAFAANVLTYVPFVLWSRHLLRAGHERAAPPGRPPRQLVVAITIPAIAVLTGVSLTFIETYQPSTNFGIRAGVIVVCFAVSLMLCAHNSQLALRRRYPPRSSSG